MKSKPVKNLLFAALCIPGLYSCEPKRPAVVMRPVFDVWNTTTIEIDMIEMNDSATIFHIDAYFRPHNWIRIDKGTYIRESGTDNRLIITGTEGISLDEETYMPESGTISFKLYFPPLPPKVTKIDFIESDCPTCFKIWGIQLLPGAKPEPDPLLQEVANAVPEPLPAPGYSVDPVKISGRFSGFVDGIVPSPVNMPVTDILTGNKTDAEFPVAADGSFGGELSPGRTGIVWSQLGPLFLIPGKEIKVYTDLRKKSRFQSRYRMDKEPGDSVYTYIAGSCFTAADLGVISQASDNLFNYGQLMQETVNMKPDEFRQHILDIMNKKLGEVKQKALPANTQMMVENAVKLETYMLLMQYEGFVSAAYMQVNNIRREDRDKVTFKPEKPGMDYYSYLKGEINDQWSYLPSYPYLTDLLGFSGAFNLPEGKDKPAGERFAYFREKFAPVLGTDKGILYDVMQAKFYGAQLREMKFYTDAEKQELRNAFKDQPVYAEALIAENDKLVAVVAANKENKSSIANEPPEVSQEKMFDAILARYKGKVVVVDFWATWCGPCMQAMKAIKPLKEEMKDRDVVFLYLTGETSPLGTWTRTYPGISGEHYRVSEAQWSYWYKTYGIEGIPAYMVCDRQGKQLAKHTGFPGVEAMKAAIEKGL